MEKRDLLLIGRLAAIGAALATRGRVRAASWIAHDFLWLYPTLRRNCDWHGEVATKFQTTEKEVWLTIDDGPDPRDTPGILDQLAAHGAKATFFVTGQNAEAHPDLCRRILAEGHTIGNHSHTHPAGLWWALPWFLVRKEIARASAAIHAATGVTPTLFRSPVGMSNRAVHPACEAEGLRVVGWSSSGNDGCPCAPSEIIRRILRDVEPGSIILLHEGGKHPKRVLTLARLLGDLGKAGFRCVLPPAESLR